MTPKSPVYHRTSDGRKVVIVGVIGNLLHVYCPIDDATECFHPHELTPWVEPETRTVYVHLWDDRTTTVDSKKRIDPWNDIKIIARKKLTITEGEFDE